MKKYTLYYADSRRVKTGGFNFSATVYANNIQEAKDENPVKGYTIVRIVENES